VESLQRDVDSLRKLRASIRSDVAVQERIAREQFGMVKGDREILYRFVPDSGAGRRR
jgi:cell division protein FtsB